MGSEERATGCEYIIFSLNLFLTLTQNLFPTLLQTLNLSPTLPLTPNLTPCNPHFNSPMPAPTVVTHCSGGATAKDSFPLMPPTSHGFLLTSQSPLLGRSQPLLNSAHYLSYYQSSNNTSTLLSKSEKWKKRHRSSDVDYYLILKPEARWPFDEPMLDCIKVHYVQTKRKSVQLISF